ncbi:MAG: response regulator [Gammaproteobacteria bacterium]|nr:response regulator [Gammaproteobacteria bacterium]NIR23871.1 response regulator [Gammaproteobacteria bacterium]NIS05320.1 response regulator [Gammaproteobacteria bacterium]NIV47947.1 response regulator [Gammaproteobacteria bacterium]NIW02653.1 response regulator [Gammaproteobacteria bacterium]
MSRTDNRSRKFTKTVLLAGQDESTGTLLEQIVREQGFKSLRAESADRCLFLALQRNFDAFLLDTELSGADPDRLCARLRGIERYKLTPIILTTESSTSPRLFRAFDAGADDFLEKPVNRNIATARLQGHLRRMTYVREAEWVRTNLNRYVSTRTRKMVEENAISGAGVEPEEHVVCVLFSDVRGFTALTREMAPTALFRMLSRHLAMQVDCVYRHGGYVDKFGGDGIMAIFDGPDGVIEACRCALQIMETTRHGRSHDGPPVLPLGIGLNTGPVLIGNIGSEDHLDYSAIGETVNLAARLCGSAPPMSIVVSEAVAGAAAAQPSFGFVDRRPINVRGIREPIFVSTLEQGAGTRARTVQPGYVSGKFDRRSM